MVLGKGSGLSIAKEGALKIKEMTYIHAEAFSAGEMKHGPIALLEPERNKTKVKRHKISNLKVYSRKYIFSSFIFQSPVIYKLYEIFYINVIFIK